MRYRSVFRSGLFEGKTVVVTGAGSGIGRCTAHELANLGASLALIGRKPEKLDAVRAEIARVEPQVRVSCHACDIRDEPAVKAAVAAVLSEHGRIDGLFNNAGGQFASNLENISLKGWDAVVRNNLGGGFLMARECYLQSMEENGGAIVNMLADMWGGMPGLGHSGAARAGMLNLTETAACEWARSGVRVNAVAPGWIATTGLENYDEAYRQVTRNLKRKGPLQRFGTESEVSAAVVFLLSEAASFITGTCLRVDGGVVNARPSWTLEAHSRSQPYNGFPLYRAPRFLED